MTIESTDEEFISLSVIATLVVLGCALGTAAW